MAPQWTFGARAPLNASVRQHGDGRSGPEDFEAAFKTASGAGGLLNIDTPLFTTYRTQFVELAARNRLPAIWSNGIIVEVGGLMSYGTNIPALFRRAATYVDKVLNGARPGDVPCRAAHEIRARDQPQDDPQPRPDDPTVSTPSGGQGDRRIGSLNNPAPNHRFQRTAGSCCSLRRAQHCSVVAAPGRLGSPTAMSRAPLNANVRLCNPTRSSCMDLQALGIEPRQGSTGQIAG